MLKGRTGSVFYFIMAWSSIIQLCALFNLWAKPIKYTDIRHMYNFVQNIEYKTVGPISHFNVHYSNIRSANRHAVIETIESHI